MAKLNVKKKLLYFAWNNAIEQADTIGRNHFAIESRRKIDHITFYGPLVGPLAVGGKANLVAASELLPFSRQSATALPVPWRHLSKG
jgi:hypothetical protein